MKWLTKARNWVKRALAVGYKRSLNDSRRNTKKEMRQIRQDMEDAIKGKDKERQEELRLYQAEIDSKMRDAAKQARDIEMSREELRRQMRDEHAREIAALKVDIERRQRELEMTSRKDREVSDELQRELISMKDKMGRTKMKDGFHYKYMYPCPGCGHKYLSNYRLMTLICTAAGCQKVHNASGLEVTTQDADI